MRMIDADALLRRYDEEHEGEPGRARKLIEEAPTVDGWISVKDRLPETQNPVIVSVPPHKDGECESYIGYVGMAYYTYSGKGGWWCGTDGALYGAIGGIPTPTHWMPLPEPPEQ